MAGSAFDCVDPFQGESIKRSLWAGERWAAIARYWDDVKPRQIAKMRDELFAIYADPAVVKAAANGPIINAQAINRPKAKARARAPRAAAIEKDRKSVVE